MHLKNKIVISNKLLLLILVISLFAIKIEAISDNNLTNNVLTKNVNITETEDINVIFKPVDNPTSLQNTKSLMVNFINRTYPISDNGTRVSEGASFNSLSIEHNKITVVLLLLRLSKAAMLSGDVKRVVGVLPANWFGYFTNQPDVLGLSFDSLPGVLVEEESGRQVSAHELGHTFGLCDEYDAGYWSNQNLWFIGRCPNGDVNDDENLDADCLDEWTGCDITTLGIVVPWSTSNNTIKLHNFMGAAGNQDVAWVSKDSYNHLLSKLKKGNTTAQKTILISGFINLSNGQTEIYHSYILDQRTLTQQDDIEQGNYSIELKDGSNYTIFNISFKPTTLITFFNGSTLQTNNSYFLFVMNFSTDLSKILLKENMSILSEINRTPNSPIVNMTYPTGGETFKYPFNVTWKASDTDNDSLAYAVLISSDNGTTYSTLSIDLNTTYFEINNGWVEEGSNYKIKVLATDGVNTGYNISSGTFTIIPPTKLSIDNSGNAIAYFDSNGNLYLKNTLINLTNPLDTADDEFLLKNDSGTVVAKINSTGYMEIKGILAQNQGTLTNPPGNDFLIKDDSNNVVARINESGYLFLKGNLYENSIS